jgi:uncharacterized protein
MTTAVKEDAIRLILKGAYRDFQEVLKRGVDVQAATPNDRWNLLHAALLPLTRQPPVQLVQQLIDLGVDFNAKDRYGNTPLHYAARSKNVPAVNVLLDAGAQIDPVNEDSLTPLRLVLTSRPAHLPTVEILLARGANVNQKTEGGITVRDYVMRTSHDDPALRAIFERQGDLKGGTARKE